VRADRSELTVTVSMHPGFRRPPVKHSRHNLRKVRRSFESATADKHRM